MEDKCIDKIENLDVNTIKLEDIKWLYGTGRSLCTGGTGRNKVHSYRSGVQTKIGDIEESVWIEIAHKVIEREGLNEMLQRLKEFYPSCISKDKTQLLKYCVAQIYDNPGWCDYVCFNQKYRPQVLVNNTQLVSVVFSCCGNQGLTTKEQIKNAFNGKIQCPYCSQFDTFQITNKSN